MSDINTPHGERATEGDDGRAPAENASSWNIEPPPADGADLPGVPDDEHE